MRIRSTKPEFWRSDRIASVPWEARLVLKALESYVDDNGVGKDDIELIVGDLFMRDLIREPSRTVARVSEAISQLSDAGLVWRYDDDGTPVLYLSFWETVQRIDKPQTGRFRRPDGTLNYKESEIRESVASGSDSSRALAPGTGEQGNRGTDLSCSSADAESVSDDAAAEFAEWYSHYPRKVGKGAALRAFKTARKKTDLATLTETMRRQTPNLTAKGIEYCPHPASWLNGERWLDADVHQLPTGQQPQLPVADDGRLILPPLPKKFFDQ